MGEGQGRGGEGGGSGGGIFLLAAGLGVVGLVGLAALTTAGSQVDRLLDTVGGTLSNVQLGQPYPAGALPAPRGAPISVRAPVPSARPNTEEHDRIDENPFKKVADEALSTFSIDVDTASYANVRRMLNEGRLPPPDAVRIEELVNYFDYDYPPPTGDAPFSAQVEIAAAPWKPAHRLARIGLKGRVIPRDQMKPANLVFLLDVSGSMSDPNKLPLLKSGLALLVANLSNRDRVAIVVYAGASGLALPSTSCDDRRRILDALQRLEAGGSTNAGAGIELAYKVAAENFIDGGTNRVILATDGDFNVGVSDRGALTRLIETKARTGVFLTVLGLGMGNYKDSTLEELSRRGNGNYAYIDTEKEARKVLVEQLGGTLVTIAKDVKIQVEFNPALVGAYRLLGYENRILAAADFNDDKKDAGEIGAGHTVTALYELVPAGLPAPAAGVDPLKYQTQSLSTAASTSGELMTVKLRYKEPAGTESKLLSFPVRDAGQAFAAASADFRFAAMVASFGMLLRHSAHGGSSSIATVIEQATAAKGPDPKGYRAEFVELARRAAKLGSE